MTSLTAKCGHCCRLICGQPPPFSCEASAYYYTGSRDKKRPYPLYYNIYRILVGLIYTGLFFYMLYREVPRDSSFWLIYLTHWTLIVLTVSLILNALHVCLGNYRPQWHVDTLSFLCKLDNFLVNLIYAPAVTVDIAYWALIYNPQDPPEDMFLNIYEHGLNALPVLIDMTLFYNYNPLTIWSWKNPFTLGLVYALFNCIYIMAGGTNREGEPFVYNVLKWKDNFGLSLVIAVAILLLVVFVHGFVHLQARVFAYLGFHEDAVKKNDNSGRKQGVEMAA